MTFTLDQVVLVSTVPSDDPNYSTCSTYRHTTKNVSKKTVSAISASSDISAVGQVYCLELVAGDAFGVKVSPFTYKDASIPVNCLSSLPRTCFSAEASLLAYHPTLSALFVYSAAKDRPLSRSFGHERLVALQASPCGRYAVAGTDTGSLVVWRIGSGDLVTVIDAAHFQAIRVIRFAEDGLTLATGGADALIKIWSWSNLISKGSTNNYNNNYNSSNISSSSNINNYSNANNISPNYLNPIYTFSQHSAPITQLSFSIGRRILSASLDSTCNLYDLVDGQLLLSLTLPAPVTSATLNATETTLYAATTEGSIHYISLNGSQTPTPSSASLKLHKGPVSALQWSIDERVLISCGAEDGIVAFWDPFSHQLLKSLQLTSKKVACTNIVVLGKSDPSINSHTLEVSPFKRIGNPLVNLATDAPLLPLPQCIQIETSSSSSSSDVKDQIKNLVKENEELRQINSELCEIACGTEE